MNRLAFYVNSFRVNEFFSHMRNPSHQHWVEGSGTRKWKVEPFTLRHIKTHIPSCVSIYIHVIMYNSGSTQTDTLIGIICQCKELKGLCVGNSNRALSPTILMGFFSGTEKCVLTSPWQLVMGMFDSLQCSSFIFFSKDGHIFHFIIFCSMVFETKEIRIA